MNNESIKTNCFGYRCGQCTILTELVCMERKCSFYKTKAQFEQDRNKYAKTK